MFIFATYRRDEYLIFLMPDHLYHLHIRRWPYTDGKNIESFETGLFNQFAHQRVGHNTPTIL